MPQSIEATTKPATEAMKSSRRPDPVGEPAGDRGHDRRGDDVGGQHPGDLVLRRPERALHRGQRHVGDRGVEHLHDRRQHDRDGDQPLVGDRRARAPAAGAAALISRPAPRPRAAPPRPSAASAPLTTFGRPRAWPVSTSTLALMPARSGGSVLAVGEAHPERHALHHLDPVAAGVLRRQQRELRAGAGADRADLALQRLVRIGVEPHLDRLAPAHVGEVGLLVVRLDPGVVGGDEASAPARPGSRTGPAAAGRSG